MAKKKKISTSTLGIKAAAKDDPVLPAVAVEEAVRQYCQAIEKTINNALENAEKKTLDGLKWLQGLSESYGFNITRSSVERFPLRLSINILFEMTTEELRKKFEKKAIEEFVKGILEKE